MLQTLPIPKGMDERGGPQDRRRARTRNAIATGIALVAMVATVLGSVDRASAYICAGGGCEPDVWSCVAPPDEKNTVQKMCGTDQVDTHQVWVGGQFNDYVTLAYYRGRCQTVAAYSGSSANQNTMLVRTSPDRNKAHFNQDTLGYPLVRDGYVQSTYMLDHRLGAGFACGWTGHSLTCTDFY